MVCVCRGFAGVDPPVANLLISEGTLLSAVSRRCWQGASCLHDLVTMHLLFQLMATLWTERTLRWRWDDKRGLLEL